MAHNYTRIFGFPPKVIALLDVDAFECQIYDRWYPEVKLMEKAGVVADQTGRIVSVTYPAKQVGISRDFRVDFAKKVAKMHNVDLAVVKKANDRDKPDGKEIRYACWEILDSLTTFRRLSGWRFIVELSSCDEFYIDLTEEINRRMAKSLSPSMVVGNRTFLELEGGQHSGENLKALVRYRYDNMLPQFFEELQHEKRLFLGALLMQEINTFVFAETRLVASVGVGGNKLMAKMAVSLNKPNGITALPNSALGRLGDILSIDKIPGYGSVFGTQIKETLKIESMNELARTEFDELEDYFGDRGIEIYLKSKGLLDESVKEKLMNDEISCGKSYYGQVSCYEALKKYFTLLVEEMLDRLDEELFRHFRYPLFLRFGIQYIPKYYEASSSSKVDNELVENTRSWCGYTAYISAQTWEGYMEHAMETFCDEDPFDIKTVKIVKLEVRAKGFEFYY